MPSIQGGGPQFQNLRPAQAAQAAPAQKVAAESQAPKDTVRVSQTPTPTTQNVQRQQLLTSETTQVRIHQLLQNSQPNPMLERPNLSILQRTSMASALAQTLGSQHVPDPPQAQNAQAQAAAGQQQATSHFKSQGPSEGQDSVWSRSAQSGRRLKKEDQEGEFSMFDDSSGQGMSQQDSSDDEHSGAKKRKLLIDEKRRQDREKAEHAAFSDKPKQKLPPVPPRNPVDTFKPIPAKTAELKKPEIKKPEIKKPEIKRMNTLKAAPPPPGKKAKADEWD
jgi:hypothetical protein